METKAPVVSEGVMSVVVTALVAWMLYMAVYRLRNRGRVGPRAWPLLGASMEALVNFPTYHDWLMGYFAKASTFPVSMPDCTYHYTADPAVVEHVLKTNFANYPKGRYFHEIMEVLLGNGIFNSDGDLWRKQRKTASFEFSSRNLREFSTVVFKDYALKLASIVDTASITQHPVDMQDLFSRLTLDSICKVGFGVEIGTLSPDLPLLPFANAFDTANEAVTVRFMDPFWKIKRYLNAGTESITAQSANIVDKFTYNVIRTRRAELETARAKGGKDDPVRSDLLSRFIQLSDDENEEQFSDESLRDVVLNFVIAGRDTTAATLSWFMYMMCLHPEVADKINAELCAYERETYRTEGKVIETSVDEHSFSQRLEEFSGVLTYEGLSKLQYLHAALTETLRLYPAVPEDAKGVLEDDVLPNGDKVKKGDLVMYVPYCMGRLKSLWGPDAYEYRPERWLKDDGSFQAVSPFKFTAFQAGPRICLGRDSAYLQLKLTTALLCRFFKFNLVPGHPVKYRMMAILYMAHGIKVTCTRRLC